MEYKETEVFGLFPEYEYTREQRRRVVLFHGYARNVKKMIRYAKNFDVPNRVCLVYLVGMPKEETLKRELASCSDRVCVLTSEFPAWGYGVWEEYEALRKRLEPFGEWGDGEPNDMYWQYKDTIEAARREEAGDEQIGLFTDIGFCRRKDAEYAETRALVERYKRLKRDCERRYFKDWRLWRNGHLTKPFTHDRLDRLIRKIYPLGGEACGASAFALTSAAGARQGASCKGVGDVEGQAREIYLTMKRDLDDRGYCNLVELANYCMSPPFGLDFNGFSAAIIATVLDKWRNRTLLYFDGCNTFEARDCAQAVFDCMFSPVRRRKPTVCLYLESQPHKRVKQFMAKLWGIKVEMPGTLMGLHLGTKLCEGHRIPLGYVDERLLKLTMWNLDFWDRDTVSALAEECERDGDGLLSAYRRYQYMNAHIPDYAKSMIDVAYSWAWDKSEYERILWQCERFGSWPWDNDTHNKANAEWKAHLKV